jgi:hypothetical protein
MPHSPFFPFFSLPARIVGAVLCAIGLSGCGVKAISSDSVAPEARLDAAFIVLGENGAAWARAITPDAQCPLITVDGTRQPMRVRVTAGTEPLRPTASDSSLSKPSAFPVTTCEFRLPMGASRATIGNRPLVLPKETPTRVVVIGDTGCRMKKADNAWQSCLDENEWPFEAVAAAAAATKPDLVIHVGDYHYRENACPASEPGCQNSPWGYGWDTWQVDLFKPGSPLLAAAPWVVVRGNHEECLRAGQGWFRFLDVRPFQEARSCNKQQYDADADYTDPYSVPIGKDLQLIVFDSARAGNSPLDLDSPPDMFTFAKYQTQFRIVDQLADKPGVTSIFANHHPILGYAVDKKRRLYGGHPALVSVMKTLHPQSYYPTSVNLALHGHVHLFQAINFASAHPATILSGIGGDLTDKNLPDPLPANIPQAEGVTLESMVHSNEFGFVLMEKQGSRWQIQAFDRHAVLKTTCLLTGSKIHCDKTGLLK